MANPLENRRSAVSPMGPMAVGDTRTFYAGERAITITRTTRDYVYDLADAYNASMPQGEVEWYVDSTGNMRIGERRRARLSQ